MAPLPIDTPWMTIREAGVYARRGPRQIRKAVADKRLRAAVVGSKRQYLFRREWLDEMIANEVINVTIATPWSARRGA
jgi:excisionase family DNA binding protein